MTQSKGKRDLAGPVFELLRTEQAKWGWPAHFDKLSPSEMHEWEMKQYAQPYARACRRLAYLLDAAQRDATVAASPEAKEFIFMVQMVIEASALGSVEHAYRLLARAVTYRPGELHKKSGDANRDNAEVLWQEHERAGKPLRGRLKWVKAEMLIKYGTPPSTTRDALVSLGLIVARKKKIG